MGKTHLFGQDVKAPVMGRQEVAEDSLGWPGCQGSCYGRRRRWVRLTWVARMSRLLLWEEEKLRKTHLGGQDDKAPVIARDIAKPYDIYVKQRSCADVNSPYKRKC